MGLIENLADARRTIAEHFDKAADPKMRFAAEMGFGQQTVICLLSQFWFHIYLNLC